MMQQRTLHSSLTVCLYGPVYLLLIRNLLRGLDEEGLHVMLSGCDPTTFSIRISRRNQHLVPTCCSDAVAPGNRDAQWKPCNFQQHILTSSRREKENIVMDTQTCLREHNTLTRNDSFG
ncbi:hypothetical protein BDW02DRAFT_124596 [Decorospora gaudefroyi]|uniref:Uncharacterized protein n=1 Tax=Decorospora gaudefroyi TaxID=184978 RepID=A0A6A5K997_9PLEO|nr:hypothetical protein BDW02DRAFT_124596 [Decorospora gaudefroyi]